MRTRPILDFKELKVGMRIIITYSDGDTFDCGVIDIKNDDFVTCLGENNEVVTFDEYGFDTGMIYIEEYLDNDMVSVRECTCGAKHTSTPDKHLTWCDIK